LIIGMMMRCFVLLLDVLGVSRGMGMWEWMMMGLKGEWEPRLLVMVMAKMELEPQPRLVLRYKRQFP